MEHCTQSCTTHQHWTTIWIWWTFENELSLWKPTYWHHKMVVELLKDHFTSTLVVMSYENNAFSMTASFPFRASMHPHEHGLCEDILVTKTQNKHFMCVTSKVIVKWGLSLHSVPWRLVFFSISLILTVGVIMVIASLVMDQPIKDLFLVNCLQESAVAESHK